MLLCFTVLKMISQYKDRHKDRHFTYNVSLILGHISNLICFLTQ